MSENQKSLTVRQQIWLAAWTAAIQSAKYNPGEEAKSCLDAFDKEFGPRDVIKMKNVALKPTPNESK